MKKGENRTGLGELAVKEHMEINGNREAVVEGCCGILEYDDTVVRVRTQRRVIRFSGRGLSIRCLTADALVVNGYLTSIEFL